MRAAKDLLRLSAGADAAVPRASPKLAAKGERR